MQPTPEHPQATDGYLIVFAHRGDSGNYPENTMLSFSQAAAYDIDALETDIHLTADGEIVVFHDETVDRTTNGSGYLREKTLAELQKLDAGYWWTDDDGATYPFRGQGLQIATLEEMFVAFPEMWINIDIKHHDEKIINPFIKLIRDHNMSKNLLVGSFDTKILKLFREKCPEVVTAASLTEVFWFFLLSKLHLTKLYRGKSPAFQIPETQKFLGLEIHLVDRKFVTAAHDKNVAVHVWTVNEVADMQRLIDLGVDGLMSDYPRRVLNLIGRDNNKDV